MIILKEEIKNKLFNLADEKYKEFHGGLCPGVNNIIGVRVPILRNYAKELIKAYHLNTLLNEIDDEFYEEIMLKGMLIGLAKEEDINTIFKYISDFVPKINNWAVCDVFCAGLKITQKYKEEMWEFIQKFVKSEEEFEIRFGIVMILDYYIETSYLNRDFEIFDKINSKDYYVQMAIAWAVSICLIKFYDKTILYLNNCNLDNFTFNKSIQKAIESYRITNEQKQYLRKMRH